MPISSSARLLKTALDLQKTKFRSEERSLQMWCQSIGFAPSHLFPLVSTAKQDESVMSS